MSKQSISVEHLGKLARLAVGEEDSKKLQQEATAILDFVSKLSEVDTSGVQPHYHLKEKSDMRSDEVIENKSQRDLIFEEFPDNEDGLLKTPKIFS